jgi:2-polyprenyl-3-methyl-5-hydroxy-6-metoxy-1,4-benzoquinol methylase
MKQAPQNNEPFPIPYNDEILRRVVAMHAAGKDLPDYWKWIHGHMGGRVVVFRERLVPQIKAFTDLAGIDILDFGCGTGSSTVALAECAPGSRIIAADVDAPSLEIARLRFAHHNMSSAIRMIEIVPIRRRGDLKLPSASVDFVLMNGVIEHVVPFEAREQVLLEVWRVLRPGGLLFISETPNPLWPIDRHTTGLPFIPWLPSRAAHRMAVLFKRHDPGSDLDARGRRGMTYWEIVRAIRTAGPVEVLNLTAANNRLLPAPRSPGDKAGLKRRIGTLVLEDGLGRLLARCGIPVVAFGPFIEYLCLRKAKT